MTIAFELSSDEADVLRETLEKAILDLRVGIAHTDAREFRAMLEHRLELLEPVLARIEVWLGAATVPMT